MIKNTFSRVKFCAESESEVRNAKGATVKPHYNEI